MLIFPMPKVPIISNEASGKFNNFLDVLDDFDEAINKLNDVDYLDIFCTNERYNKRMADSLNCGSISLQQ